MKRKKKKAVKKRRFGRKIVLVLAVIFLPFVLMLLLMAMLISGSQASKNTSSAGVVLDGEYTDHWSTGDPYTHNLFVKRYGITAEQLDGYLDSTGIKYDKLRINGAKLLNWERASGVDVRAIIAMAPLTIILKMVPISLMKLLW